MKNILKFSVLAVSCVVMSLFSGCTSPIDTDQFADTSITLAAVQPNPVMRGGELSIVGSNLENVTEVRFAGGVTVTSIKTVTTGRKSEIRLTVPLEGPEVGPVTIVARNGQTASTKADLTFTEPISIDGVTPEVALSGDIITVTGEYLNLVQEVILGGDVYVTGFSAQSRHELQFVLPANAVTGYLILADVNEMVDENTIPNKIYSPEELQVGDPTVKKAAKATYKAGDQIKVEGEHLDMIEQISLTGVNEVDFAVSEDGTSILFNLPAAASDGDILLKSFAGKEFDAGEIETVFIADVVIQSMAEDGRYKAGAPVEITGEDLDLVTAVNFTGAEASWYYDSGKIITEVPAAAQDGSVTLTLGSGKEFYSDPIEVVKPVIEAYDGPDAVAGVTVIGIGGADLDLVVSAKMGTKEKGFVECPFTFIVDPQEGTLSVGVEIPRDAYTSPITLAAANGYEVSTGDIIVSYDEAITVYFDAPAYGLGNNIKISGANLLLVEQIYIKGKKVTNYALRADDAMSFGIPENIGPGVYRLNLVLTDGTEMTWPVPFEITAPFTETFIWEGYHDLAGWGANLEAGPEDGFVKAGLQEGDLVRVYYTTYNDWWQFKLQDGHWAAINLEILGGGNTVCTDNAPSGTQYFSFEVDAAILAQLTTVGQGWGYSFVINGEGAIITGISMIHFGAASVEDVLWEGYVDMAGWSAQPYLGPHDYMSTHEVPEGSVVRFYITPLAEEFQMQIFDGNWKGQITTANQDNVQNGIFEIELTQALINQLTGLESWGGLFVVQGDGCAVTQLSVITTASVGPMEHTVWEGSEDMADWANQPYIGACDYVTENNITAGTVARFYITPTAEEFQMQIFDGNWKGQITTANQDNVVDGVFEFELTQALIDQLTGLESWGGLFVVQGAGCILKQVAFVY